ncbi:MAG: glycosyltransferase family 2 protein [Candidatus Omnitrophica bacterium]|nr:glycosyltransferase family 2 protein [Candidatus Omnitrophota bacterium]
MKILFWFSLITLLYLYFGYPLIIYLLSFFYKKPICRKYIYPSVSILLPVYNEAKHIERKIKSLLEIEYPDAQIEIIIGSDGSTDKTDEIIEQLGSKKIKFFRHEQRKGKPSMLNLLAAQAKGEILVLTDARQKLDKMAVKELVRNFTDRRVGSVSAELHFENEKNKAGNGIGFYWRYEKFIRHAEAKMGSMLGATGALYAVRKDLFSRLPEDIILDDVYIPLNVILRGYRAIFEPKAKIYDRVSKNPKEEFVRKARSHAGNFQLFYYFPGFFNPFRGKISWQFFSHKFLRLLGPFLLAAFFVSNLFLVKEMPYGIVFLAQALFYLLALWGVVYKKAYRLFDIPHMFCLMNTAALVGLYRFLLRKQNILWRKGEVAHV